MREFQWLISSFAISMLFMGTLPAEELSSYKLARGGLSVSERCDLAKFGFLYDKEFSQSDLGGTVTCKEANFRHADRVYQEVKALVDAGKYKQAETAVKFARATPEVSVWNPDNEVCVRPSLEKPFHTLIENIGRQMAGVAEKGGRLVEAIRVHDEYCQFAEAARVHAARVKTSSFRERGYSEEREFHEALSYSKVHSFDNLRNALREVATSRVDRFRQIEDKFFTKGSSKGAAMLNLYTPENLERALGWLPYTGDGGSQKKTIMTLAEKRGDAVSPDEGCQNLDTAIAYYKISGNQAKVKQATAKGTSLGETYEKRSAFPAAAKCYEAVGATDKASRLEDRAGAVREQKAAEYEKKEKVRQKTFSKEQDDLENELGF